MRWAWSTERRACSRELSASEESMVYSTAPSSTWSPSSKLAVRMGPSTSEVTE